MVYMIENNNNDIGVLKMITWEAEENGIEITKISPLEYDMNMTLGIDKLCAKINADFVKFMSLNDTADEAYVKNRINEFRNQLQYSVGKKYIKITSGRSVWGFVVLKDSDRIRTGDLFSAGDILKPAGANAPARNFARGNVLNNDFSRVRWEGAE